MIGWPHRHQVPSGRASRPSRPQPHILETRSHKGFQLSWRLRVQIALAPSIIELLLPTDMSISTNATAAAQAAVLYKHFTRTVLLIWRGPGFDSSMQLP